MSTESFDSLWSYCTANDRVCPMPQRWNELFQKLKDTRRAGNGWEPALPLILAAWDDTGVMFKTLRLREHIEWARDHGQLDEIGTFTRALREKIGFISVIEGTY